MISGGLVEPIRVESKLKLRRLLVHVAESLNSRIKLFPSSNAANLFSIFAASFLCCDMVLMIPRVTTMRMAEAAITSIKLKPFEFFSSLKVIFFLDWRNEETFSLV